MTESAVWIKTDGQEKEVKPKNGNYFLLRELRGFVGGNIEMVELVTGEMMVLNEEGKLLGLPHNRTATLLFNAGNRAWYDPICGDVLVCSLALLGDGDDAGYDMDDLDF